MMGQKVIGRERESKLLREYVGSVRSELIVVYGRRRVGKTFLIREILGNQACFYMTGMENANMHDQLANFYFTLRRCYPSAIQPRSWIEAFDQLQSYLEKLPKGPKILWLDELPWLDTVRSKFIAALERFWNGWADGRGDIKLIVSGSATSWMMDNILCNRGGLHNRKTHQLYIAPFTLDETRRYFKAFGFGYREKEIAECYMVMGGVPYYYSLMNAHESVAQNIDRLFFARHGELHGEFDILYRSLFKKADDHINVISAIAKRNKGLTRKQLLAMTKLNNNHKFTRTLEELEQCGFIRSYIPFEETKRDVLFQLTDAFTLFHFHYSNANKYQDEKFWSNSLNSPRYRAWSGYAFEMLCLNHVTQLKMALGIIGVQSRVCCWSSKEEKGHDGAQIDLLIDRADNTINICEMKFWRTEYIVSKADDDDFNNKMEAFIRQTGTKKSLILTLVTSYGVKPGKYSGQVQQQVTLRDLMK